MSDGWRESALARSVHSDTASCRYTPCCHGNIVAVDHLLINCLCKKCWKDGLERWSCTVCPNVLHLTFLLFLSCSSLLPFCLLIIPPYLPPSFSSSLFPSLSLPLSASDHTSPATGRLSQWAVSSRTAPSSTANHAHLSLEHSTD